MTTQLPIRDPQTPRGPLRRRRRTVAAGLAASALATLFATTVPAAHADAAKPTAARSVESRLQAILDRSVRGPRAGFPGVALYVRRPGHAPWSGAAGKARIDPAQPMRPGARFRAGSIMKPFVAAATLQLVEEGRFSLDDPLPAVLAPDVVARFPDADRITVRMLLNHTSGIAEYSDDAFDAEVAADPRRRWTVEELLNRAAAQPRTGAPGERFTYANTNYNLLGLILERATGKPWRTVVRDRVIDRLGLEHTTLPQPGRIPTGRGIAHGYQVMGGALRDLTGIDASMADAAGGHALLTTTADLSRFLRGVLGGRLFERRETLRTMRTFVTTPNDNGRVGYGLGLERYVLPGGVEMVGHMGTTGGYRAFTFRLPAQRIDFAMVTTTPGDPMPVLAPALQLLLAEAS